MANRPADEIKMAPAHGCVSGSDHDREVPEIDLLSSLKIRGVTFHNRIAMSPMCQYVANEGLADDWDLVDIGSLCGGRCRADNRRGHGGDSRRPDHTWRPRHLERRPRRAAGADRPLRAFAGGGRPAFSSPTPVEGELRLAVEGRGRADHGGHRRLASCRT